MTDYTPTGTMDTEWVRRQIVWGGTGFYEKERTAEFDFWLAKVIADAKAEQKETDAAIAEDARPESGPLILMSEYRTGKIDACNIIAAAIRTGDTT